jgi:hypothetical protein
LPSRSTVATKPEYMGIKAKSGCATVLRSTADAIPQTVLVIDTDETSRRTSTRRPPAPSAVAACFRRINGGASRSTFVPLQTWRHVKGRCAKKRHREMKHVGPLGLRN